jgi:hypothetical protein
MKKSKDPVIGLRIVDVRGMTSAEVNKEGWGQSTTVLVLEDGTKIYASRDEEGNGPGALFGTGKGGSFMFPTYRSNKGRRR